jgi:hypothetical protein
MSTPSTTTSLKHIAEVILNEASPAASLQQALDEFASHCSNVSGIVPDPSFDGWADDTLLDHGVAINPQAAAFCVKDYLRSVVFIRGLNAAIHTAQQRFKNQPIKIIYAGCGPFATLMLPLLCIFEPRQLELHLLDVHQRSLDSVSLLLDHFGLNNHLVKTIKADACYYQHPETLQLIVAETMQKSLEQEPQFTVTQNLAPQLCAQGIFIPEKIEVELCLAHLQDELDLFKRDNRIDPEALIRTGRRYPLSCLLALKPEQASAEFKQATHNPVSGKYELAHQLIEIPATEGLSNYDVLIFTRIQVFGHYTLNDYDSEISLPYPCNDLLPLEAGAVYESCYELGGFPRFNFNRIE